MGYISISLAHYPNQQSNNVQEIAYFNECADKKARLFFSMNYSMVGKFSGSPYVEPDVNLPTLKKPEFSLYSPPVRN